MNYAYFFHPQAGWNVNSRIALTYALIDYGTLQIDNYYSKEEFYTGDVAFYQGHYYSDKIIGVSLLGTIPYGLLRLFGGRYFAEHYPDLARYITTTFSVSLFGALAVPLMYDILLLFSATPATALILTLLFAFGTMLFPYSTVFYPYAPAIFFILLAWRKILQNSSAFSIGLSLGLSLLFDYTFGIVVAALTIYLLLKQSSQNYELRIKKFKLLPYYIAGIFLALVPFVIYSVAIFGAPTIPYKYEAYPLFQKGMEKGFMGITTPRLTVLYYITIHPYRGLFILSPFLIFSFIGAWKWLQRKKFTAETILSLIIIVGYLLFNSAYYMWWGGWAVAPRLLFPMLPFMFPLLIPILDSKPTPKSQFLTPPFYLAGLIGVLFNFITSAIEPQEPQGYQTIFLLYPRISFNLQSRFFYRQIPAFLRGELDPNLATLLNIPALFSLIPLILISILLLIFIYLPIKRRRPEGN